MTIKRKENGADSGYEIWVGPGTGRRRLVLDRKAGGQEGALAAARQIEAELKAALPPSTVTRLLNVVRRPFLGSKGGAR